VISQNWLFWLTNLPGTLAPLERTVNP
jgi:hypothetical protein